VNITYVDPINVIDRFESIFEFFHTKDPPQFGQPLDEFTFIKHKDELHQIGDQENPLAFQLLASKLCLLKRIKEWFIN
jgi:hypothetical protein